MLKKIARWAAAAVVFAGIYVICLYAVQDYLIFFPDKFYVGPQSAGVPAFREQPLVTADGRMVMAWYAEGEPDKPAILFFHGNAGQIATFAPRMEAYRKAGYSVLMPEYRGFAHSGGELSEDNMYADAVAAFDYLEKQPGHKGIVVFGYSMGTAPAAAVAGLRSPDGLILAAPFRSLYREVTEKKIPLAGWVLTRHLESDKFVAAYEGPLLIVHGSRDRLILPHHGRELFELAPSLDKQFRLAEQVDHNRLFFDEANHRIMLEWLTNRFN